MTDANLAQSICGKIAADWKGGGYVSEYDIDVSDLTLTNEELNYLKSL